MKQQTKRKEETGSCATTQSSQQRKNEKEGGALKYLSRCVWGGTLRNYIFSTPINTTK